MMSKEKIIQGMKERVFEANLILPKSGLVKLTWGNVSEVNREIGIIVIKPSGVPYDSMKVEDMVVVDLDGNNLRTDSLKPSSDLPTHIFLYKEFSDINALVHTHSTNAVMWSQAGKDVPAYGTTHADTFYGSIPCTRELTEDEIKIDYETNTGKVIVETFKNRKIKASETPAVLVSSHGPFTWGKNPMKAVEASMILEEVCIMAKGTEEIKKEVKSIPNYLLDKHYLRKHGKNAYYGQ